MIIFVRCSICEEFFLCLMVTINLYTVNIRTLIVYLVITNSLIVLKDCTCFYNTYKLCGML